MSSLSPCTAWTGEFRGWSAAHANNGLITVVAVPDIGGRIMAYDLGPYPFVYVDRDLAGQLFTPEENLGDGTLAAWKNYGGDKTWPAPQGWDSKDQWHGPPDPVLDTGRYTLDVLESSDARGTIAMTSPPDRRTGVQITRQATISRGSSRVTLRLTFQNVLNEPIRWSIWDVMQLRAERRLPDGSLTHEPACAVTTPLNPNSRYPGGFNVMFGDKENPQWRVDEEEGLFVAPYMWEIGKVGIDSLAGWVAFANAAAGYAFAEQHRVEENAEYPDDGARVECWTIGRGQVDNLDYEGRDIYLMETEVLSPFLTIEPGEQRSFTITWGSCRFIGDLVVDVTDAGCVGERLSSDPSGEFVHLTGQFGTFDVGELVMVWTGEDGRDLVETALGPTTPLAALTLDRVERPPDGADRVGLHVVSAATGEIRRLAEAEL